MESPGINAADRRAVLGLRWNSSPFCPAQADVPLGGLVGKIPTSGGYRPTGLGPAHLATVRRGDVRAGSDDSADERPATDESAVCVQLPDYEG